VVVFRYFISASLPQTQRAERRDRLNLKNIRSILGMVKKDNTVKHGALRMTWEVDPAHGRDSDSRNVPGRRDD